MEAKQTIECMESRDCGQTCGQGCDQPSHQQCGQPASPRTSHRPKIWFVVRKNRRMAFSKCCWVNFGHHGYLFGPWKWFSSTATNPKILGSFHTMFFDDLGIQNQQKKHLGIWPQASFIQNVISVRFFPLVTQFKEWHPCLNFYACHCCWCSY